MIEVTELILSVLRQAWLALAGALAAAAMLVLLAQTLRAAAGSALLAGFWAWQAISAGAAVLILVLFALLGVPSLVGAVQRALPEGGGCGPAADLGALAAALIATEPLSEPGDWTPFVPGELRIYRAGALLGRILARPETAPAAADKQQ